MAASNDTQTLLFALLLAGKHICFRVKNKVNPYIFWTNNAFNMFQCYLRGLKTHSTKRPQLFLFKCKCRLLLGTPKKKKNHVTFLMPTIWTSKNVLVQKAPLWIQVPLCWAHLCPLVTSSLCVLICQKDGWETELDVADDRRWTLPWATTDRCHVFSSEAHFSMTSLTGRKDKKFVLF